MELQRGRVNHLALLVLLAQRGRDAGGAADCAVVEGVGGGRRPRGRGGVEAEGGEGGEARVGEAVAAAQVELLEGGEEPGLAEEDAEADKVLRVYVCGGALVGVSPW